ncbi:helix-turn-helix domain-containing protein [Chromobacterium sp. IIBBL 290-4]|uniref:helix-turn-helix domain-containing protein n=1 Tax=Chromobacterium sp. IIBBL 290-4 TaxID=2953890 RepID=UPI0020B6BD03|nr:helix-turn-helix domain-containing protein [Chromobacterium sp. IIBBL 290-4]UTH73590.1 helix-turn-helix domain-containing protein [Chromobacterium sp. IIBBL 290-4]
MRQSVDYLKEAMEKLGESSQAKAARALKITPTALSRYLSGERTMDEFTCIMVAKVLEINGIDIIAAAQMEREKDAERRAIWEDFRKQLGVKTGIVGLAAILMMGSPAPVKASGRFLAKTQDVVLEVHSTSILCQIKDADDSDDPDTPNLSSRTGFSTYPNL